MRDAAEDDAAGDAAGDDGPDGRARPKRRYEDRRWYLNGNLRNVLLTLIGIAIAWFGSQAVATRDDVRDLKGQLPLIFENVRKDIDRATAERLILRDDINRIDGRTTQLERDRTYRWPDRTPTGNP